MEALHVIDEAFAGCPLVTTVGATSRELASFSRRPSHLYLLDSMGLAPAVGAGLAFGLDRPVAVVEGDGSLLMGLSVIATLAYHRPPRFTLILLDNHQHASAASIETQAERIDLGAVCAAAGLPTVRANDADALGAALRTAREDARQTVVHVAIEGGNSPGVPFLLDDPVAIRTAFTNFLEQPR
ncbi:thiamine pyrophosphate-dependent enzyme [Conexibacter sp. CPCC 206217]|uniref:thiamine pyrophosphate-dependent enzyme n=1 Tax=Conexibacter sp. CPCC 206217 TaxID=3064574 RepID=UPI0027291C03|nr:thiamine pyrophosphate-dependent enzyme [Conexibacter sp. CPCC 206217]MDO8208919.1 thiamine pyrophosphate-dependent enzyme [Conexibacter sp. CPCC 206217]